MTGRARLLFLVGLAVAIGAVSACAGFVFNTPGTITVTNASATETAVLAILGDDVKSYPTLGPGQSAKVTTETGGAYQVIVVMSAIDAANYRNNLQTLRQNVAKVVDGTASTDEKVVFFTHLAGIRSAINQSENAGGASCSGRIDLSEDEAARVSATVAWQSSLGSGFWALTCGSN